MRLVAGTFLGRFEILAAIGSGGMGEVYRARDTRLKREVAVKVLLGAWADDTDRLSRFEREAELLAAVNHPNIAAIYGIEEIDGVRALILELVAGPTLADRIARGPLPLGEAMAVSRQIIDALDAAHERGIVHRDLKPSNVKLRDDGAVKVLDFGLAKTLDAAAARADGVSPTVTSPVMTGMGVILGTAAYMSPEQARGQTIDKRTDIWAFGCVLYEMLSGQPAFGRSTVPDTVAAILERDADWSVVPRALPIGVERLLRRCLQKNRSQRLRDIGDARFALDEIEEDARRAPESISARRWPLLLSGAAILLVAGGIAAALVMRDETTAPLGAHFTRITTDAAYSTEPALSRDGTVVVYASDRGGEGQLDLWLQRTAGGEPLRLTDDPADDRQPDFSPDGSLIAFRSNRAGTGVYVMPALGGDPRLVAEGGRRPRFSPDSASIAYWTGPWLSGIGPRQPGSSVFVIPATGGRPRPIAEGFATARDPIWSPDGTSLLFAGGKAAGDSPDSAFDWWWAPLDGRAPVRTGALDVLREHGLAGLEQGDGLAELKAMPVVWTASGVLFSAHRGEGVNLWRIAVSQQTGHLDPASLERLTHGTGTDVLPSADASGRVAFQVISEGYVSLSFPLDANAGRAIGPIARRSFVAGQDSGRNSLDESGRWLAYTKTRANEGQIWLKDLTTDHERHLVTTPPAVLNPVVSPDATKVAYSLPDGARSTGHIVSASGGTATQVCDRCALFGWFADSRRVLAANREGSVRALDVVDGTAVELLFNPHGAVGRPGVSPDDRWLSFESRRTVYVAPVQPGSPPPEGRWVAVLETLPDTAERACGWSPDSRLLYLLLERDGFRDVYAQRLDPARGTPEGEPFIVQHLHDPRRRWGSTPFGNAVSRNAFLFSQIEMTGSIWLMDSSPGAGPTSARVP